MRALYYILKNGEPVVEHDVRKWGEWFSNFDNRRIAKTTVGGIDISTVFLGIDHSFMFSGAPVLFETMIFGGEHSEYQERYCTLDDAMIGHERAVALVKGEIKHGS